MLKEQRYNEIINYLKINNSVDNNTLAKLLKVSLDTIRRDLKHMEQLNLLKSVHGGAIINANSVKNKMFEFRKIKNIEKKQDIAKSVCNLIVEEQTIALNAGTTNIEVAKVLVHQFKKLTVITNSIYIANIFAENKNITIILPGGVLNNEEYSLYGKECEQSIKNYNIDIAIISVNAISIEKGITDFRMEETAIIKAMMKSASKTMVVCDTTKLETFTYINVCELKEVDMLVTNSDIDNKLKAMYMNNINII